MRTVLILGINGLIGHHLATRILETTNWHVYGMDVQRDRVEGLLSHKRFHFFEGNITINREWIEYHVSKCDVVLPLVAITTPAVFAREPLRVFELDFEANLRIVRQCVEHRKRVIFPSASEVYGLSSDSSSDPTSSNLVYGPINKQRWIYACSKQLMDRVIWAYGFERGLQFTIFRPFNLIGSGLDSLDASKEGTSRVLTQFLGHIMRGEDIRLVDGGHQKRSFTHIDDAVDALMIIIQNNGNIANGKIYNIGNPGNNVSVRELAERMLGIAKRMPEYSKNAHRVRLVETTSAAFYGTGYQNVMQRVPDIQNITAELGWRPRIGIDEALEQVFEAYRGRIDEARRQFAE